MNFKIPYVPGKTNPSHMQMCIDRKIQYPYTKDAVEKGFYRKWIAAMNEETLSLFIKTNESRMRDSLETKMMGPNWKIISELLYRNALYMVEMHLRHNEDTERLDEDLHLYYDEWYKKYELALHTFIKQNNDKMPNETSGINPYY